MNRKLLQNGLILFISTIWIVFFGLEYIDKHYVLQEAFTYFRYPALLCTILATPIVWYLAQRKYKIFKELGLKFVFLLCSFYLFASLHWGTKYFFEPFYFSDGVRVYFKTLLVLIAVILVFFSARVWGKWVTGRFKEFAPLQHPLIELGIGMMIFTYLLFFLAAFGQLKMIIVGGLLIIPLFYDFVKNFDINKYKNKYLRGYDSLNDLNIWGMLSFCLLCFITVLDFFYIQGEIPIGFDARNFYINVAKLLADNGAIVERFQPYSGSLLESVGYVVFKSNRVVQGISMFGGVLSLFVLWSIMRDYIGFSKNWTWFALLVIIATPSVSHQFYLELKIDLLLLFNQLVTLFLLMRILKYKQSFFTVFERDKESIIYLVVLGSLLGFGMTIKVLNIIVIILVVAYFWWNQKYIWSSMGILAIVFGLIIIGKFTEMAGLSSYHLHQHTFAYICIGLGTLAILIQDIYQKSIGLELKRVTNVTIMIVVIVITFSPWAVKHYMEEFNERTVKSLVIGTPPGYLINTQKVFEQYNASLQLIEKQLNKNQQSTESKSVSPVQ